MRDALNASSSPVCLVPWLPRFLSIKSVMPFGFATAYLKITPFCFFFCVVLRMLLLPLHRVVFLFASDHIVALRLHNRTPSSLSLSPHSSAGTATSCTLSLSLTTICRVVLSSRLAFLVVYLHSFPCTPLVFHLSLSPRTLMPSRCSTSRSLMHCSPSLPQILSPKVLYCGSSTTSTGRLDAATPVIRPFSYSLSTLESVFLRDNCGFHCVRNSLAFPATEAMVTGKRHSNAQVIWLSPPY